MAIANDMVRLLEEAIKKNLGVNSIQVDGTTVSYASREAMIKELQFWQRQASKAAGTRKLFRGVNIGSMYSGGTDGSNNGIN